MRARRIIACGLLELAFVAAVQLARGENVHAIHRCIGANGEIAFSGLPCTATGSAAAAVSTPGTAIDPLPGNACSGSREELRDRVAAAVARHDSNALAGILRWRGVGARTADSRLRTLRELVQHPLIAIDADDSPGEAIDDPPSPDIDSLRVRTGGDNSVGPHEHAFGVASDERCYWLVW